MYVLSLNHVIHIALTSATLACYVSAVICVAEESLNVLTIVLKTCVDSRSTITNNHDIYPFKPRWSAIVAVPVSVGLPVVIS